MDRDRREVLQELLLAIDGIDHVYFQPPSDLRMQYPCIVYSRDAITTEFAGDRPYLADQRYQITVIDREPDNGALKSLAFFPRCRYSRYFSANNLHHDVFTIYF